MYVQQVLRTLNAFWQEKGCILWQPYHTEVGAGTSNPATFLRVLGPEPWWVAYPEPSTRPQDGRYGENPNRLQHYYQYQVILKPSPSNVQELFLQSLEALGLDLTRHDYRFVEDNWQSPSLGAWGLGWEAWLDGMEITQFTYFQECGGLKLDVRACELTYGIERIAMYLQGVDSVYDLVWAPSGITYGEIFHKQEVEYCHYNFEAADVDRLFQIFDMWEAEAKRLLDLNLVLPAYDHCLRLSHLFNVLDARGALSVTERGRFLLRCRSVAEGCAKAFFAQREEMGFPLRRLDVPDETPRQEPLEVDRSAFADKAPLLIEIGVEELPHKDVGAALAQAPRLVENYLKENGIEHGSVSAYCGPRRIAVRIEDMPARQADVEQEKRGPKKKSALDDQGNWTMPARKFAEGQGATVEDIYFEEQGKDEYCFVKLTVKGKRLVEMANDLTRGLVRGMQFGKSMGWENTTTTFSRPVRWLLALHGDKPLPVSCMLREAGEGEAERVIHSGAVTYGHRRLKPGPIEVPDANAYLDVLRERLVLADRDERMRVLREKVAARAEEAGLAAEDDDDLLQEICDLAEWPEPILCEIPDEAMVLPEPIIITPMKVHQRYIPLRGAEGKLSRRFLAVANGEHDEQGRGVIKAGNEKVLNARLRDARYFWDNDLKTPLRLFGERLNNILFHKELGSVADKITRIRDLFFTLRESLPKVDGNRMEEVLLLMKADLTTQMVYEFDSLEGVVGMLYAREQGIDDDIARAILDHRLPRRAGDSIPQERLGLVAGLLDRFDTLAGYFGIGIRPKGTSDPFGLRRNALALLSIIHQRGLDIDLDQFARAALANYGSVIHSPDNSLQALLDFMADRLEVLAREEGHHHDYVRAALAAHRRRPVRFYNCLEVMSRLDAPQVQELAEQAKRIQRIAKEPAEQFDAALLADNEQALANLLGDPADRIEDAVEEGDFSRAFDEALAWAPIISAYFEEVLVNDKDDAVRRNRHALLQRVFAGFTAPADFTAVEKREV